MVSSNSAPKWKGRAEHDEFDSSSDWINQYSRDYLWPSNSKPVSLTNSTVAAIADARPIAKIGRDTEETAETGAGFHGQDATPIKDLDHDLPEVVPAPRVPGVSREGIVAPTGFGLHAQGVQREDIPDRSARVKQILDGYTLLPDGRVQCNYRGCKKRPVYAWKDRSQLRCVTMKIELPKWHDVG